jgi:hypothetical protein
MNYPVFKPRKLSRVRCAVNSRAMPICRAAMRRQALAEAAEMA